MGAPLARRRLTLVLAAAAVCAITRNDAAGAGAQPGTIVLSGGRNWGHLTVTNTGLRPVFLQPLVLVEAWSGGTWHGLVTEMNLVPACDLEGVVRPLPGHVELPAGATLSPPPWRGWSCNGQCECHCRSNTYWGGGPFRFRVLSADASSSYISKAFAMPKIPTRPDDTL